MIVVRDEMRDFFSDHARDREFEEKQAEIVHAIHDNIELNNEHNESKQDKILHQLSSITKQLTEMKKEMKSIKSGHRIKRVASKAQGGGRQISFQSDKDAAPTTKHYNNNDTVLDEDIGLVGDIKTMDQRFLSTQL
eukprot:CAMPEP_0201571894 /NCGR_PEP_ID=MMETSP0190_2-20130828/14883_1 /ASSEMBLY_ACC=CAM_ASM_000263 /TAXON_ID=37353 /ORGANISM="Rosalina sp." /LENGTH=135 /DNA_ID=CAMNT_0047997049 /DNA_START=105 /DNA_END=512 /DNA_ORIENTATION=+